MGQKVIVIVVLLVVLLLLVLTFPGMAKKIQGIASNFADEKFEEIQGEQSLEQSSAQINTVSDFAKKYFETIDKDYINDNCKISLPKVPDIEKNKKITFYFEERNGKLFGIGKYGSSKIYDYEFKNINQLNFLKDDAKYLEKKKYGTNLNIEEIFKQLKITTNINYYRDLQRLKYKLRILYESNYDIFYIYQNGNSAKTPGLIKKQYQIDQALKGKDKIIISTSKLLHPDIKTCKVTP